MEVNAFWMYTLVFLSLIFNCSIWWLYVDGDSGDACACACAFVLYTWRDGSDEMLNFSVPCNVLFHAILKFGSFFWLVFIVWLSFLVCVECVFFCLKSYSFSCFSLYVYVCTRFFSLLLLLRIVTYIFINICSSLYMKSFSFSFVYLVFVILIGCLLAI